MSMIQNILQVLQRLKEELERKEAVEKTTLEKLEQVIALIAMNQGLNNELAYLDKILKAEQTIELFTDNELKALDNALKELLKNSKSEKHDSEAFVSKISMLKQELLREEESEKIIENLIKQLELMLEKHGDEENIKKLLRNIENVYKTVLKVLKTEEKEVENI